jgi:hypothetical protein
MVSILTRLGLTPKDLEGVKPTSAPKLKNAPPPPDSCAGNALELERLLAQQAEQEPEPDAAEPELTDEDVVDKLLEETDDEQP